MKSGRNFEATVFGEGNQVTDHQWTLGSNGAASGAALDSLYFGTAGTETITLETTILDQVLQQVQLFSTGGGWDDFFGNPDPYFTLKDGNDNVVYTSSTVDDAGSATWTGLNVVLNNPPYALDFYDEDLFDGDDWLGWAPFTPNGPGTISIDANPSNAQLTIGLDPVVTVVDAAELVVHPLPEVGIVLSGADGVACPNDSLLQYSWSLSGAAVAGGPDASYTPEQSGWYTVMALDSNGCSSMSDSILFCLPDAGMPLTLNESNGIPMGLETSVDHPWWAWYFNGNWPTSWPGAMSGSRWRAAGTASNRCRVSAAPWPATPCWCAGRSRPRRSSRMRPETWSSKATSPRSNGGKAILNSRGRRVWS